MNDQTPNAPNPQDLQFDQAEYTEPTAAETTCVACQRPIPDQYYQVNGAILCEPCSSALKAHLTGGSSFGRFAKACLFGFGAAIAGFAIYYGVLKITGLEIGLISILVGFMVGVAVRRGSEGRGGLLYQLTAVFFTYLAIAVSYSALLIPEMIDKFKEKKAGAAVQPRDADKKPDAKKVAQEDPADEVLERKPLTTAEFVIGVSLILGFLCALPIISGFSQPIGLLIVAFALWEAFKLNKKAELVITGPHQVGPAPDRALANV